MTDAIKPALNAGAQALKASGLTQREIAQLCGVAAGTAARWLQGLRVPSPEIQVKLSQWVQPHLWPAPPPGALAQRQAKAKAKPPKTVSLPALPRDYVPPDYGEPNTATEREIIAQCHALHRISTQLRAARDFDLTRWLAVERQHTVAIQALAKFRQELTPTAERNLLNTPTVQRLLKSILDALQPYPEASLAVIQALETTED